MAVTRANVFLSAIDSGSLSRAAEMYGYTPSGVSHMMTAFEEEVGFPLLIRTKTGVMPTPNAEKLIPILRAQCRCDELLLQTVSEINGLAKGSITIAAYSSIASQWLPEVVARFHNDYPGISINLLEGIWQEVENNLQEHRADLGLYSYRKSSKHRWVPLKRDPMVVAVPPSHRLARQDHVTLTDLKGEQLIIPARGADVDVADLLKDQDLTVDLTFQTLENYSAMGLVEQGLGIMIMNELITKGRDNKMKILPIEPATTIDLGIAIPKESQQSPAVMRFVEYARAIIVEGR